MESPLTGKRNVKRLGVESTAEIAARWKSRLDVKVGGVFCNIGELQYYRCEDSRLHPPEFVLADSRVDLSLPTEGQAHTVIGGSDT